MHPATVSVTRALSWLLSFFVNPTRSNNVPGNYLLSFFFFTAEGFDDRETVIDGIFFFLRLNCQVTKPALF